MDAELMPTLSEMILVARKRMHLSQTELAKAAGISRNYVSFIERGNIEHVSLGVLKKICDELGIRLSAVPEAKK
jgi:transcriptional regulator with XRE-family HTH domain